MFNLSSFGSQVSSSDATASYSRISEDLASDSFNLCLLEQGNPVHKFSIFTVNQ